MREHQWIREYINSIYGLDEDTLDLLGLRAFLTAFRYKLYSRWHSNWPVWFFYSFVLVFAAFGLAAGQGLREPNVRTASVNLIFLLIMVASVWVIIAGVRPYAKRIDVRNIRLDLAQPSRRQQARFVLNFTGAALTLWLVNEAANPARHENIIGFFVVSDEALIKLEVALTFASFVILLVPPALALARSAPKRQYPSPLPFDVLMLRLLVVAYWINWCTVGRRWADRKNVLELIGEIESIARDAERFAVRRVPRFDGTVRREVRGKGLLLASIVRAHKIPLAEAIGPKGFLQVAESITKELAAWTERDMASMIEFAHPVKLSDRIRPAIRWTLPALILAGLSLGLPALPVFDGAPQAAQTVRVTLLIAAALAAVTGGASIAGSDRSPAE